VDRLGLTVMAESHRAQPRSPRGRPGSIASAKARRIRRDPITGRLPGPARARSGPNMESRVAL